MKNHFLFFPMLIMLFLAIFLFGCISAPASTPSTSKITTVTFENNRIITAEIADTQESRSVGLMNRTKLEEQKGMLFIFSNSDYHSFWMKNTLIPLDIIFIDEKLKIVDIISADPCISDPCKLYTPQEKTKYVLEVNQNWTKRNRIEIGIKIKIES